ncbi:MAG TPA: peptide chain release factor N(5)-glutamine methyltransferase [Anaerolineae bacterium]|nr:peptide chain release factor N(5)-glutamine methyltransferase [Anaerolineae bacterium]
MAYNQNLTVRAALAKGSATLLASGIPSPVLDSEVLLAHVLGWNRTRLFARPEYTLTQEQEQRYEACLARRQRHEPVPYIVGSREFYGLTFAVDRRVLIPRPETEQVVERALESVSGGPILIADVGTGSGIIAISLAVHLPLARVYAIDSSSDALEVAASNCRRHNLIERVRLLQGDLLEPLPERVDLIAANLPYVPTPTLATLDVDVRDYEPWQALDGGPDGLAQVARLLGQASRWLRPRGAVVLEIGAEQGERAACLARDSFPGARVEVFQDFAGLDRVVRVRTPD